MSEQKCGNCYFYREERCRRYAPAPYHFYRYYLGELIRDCAYSLRKIANVEVPPKGDDVLTEATEATSLIGFPEMEADDWCGEWKLQAAEEQQREGK